VNQLDSERVESVIKKWGDQIRRNEDDFKTAAHELLEQEAFIRAAIEHI
jgi:hypothetical protein